MDPDEFEKLLQTILNDKAKIDLIHSFYMDNLYDILNEYEDERESTYISSIFQRWFMQRDAMVVLPAVGACKVIVL